MGGKYMVGVSAEHRAGAGVGGGDEVDVDIELDDEPRMVQIPPELAKALAKDKTAKATFDALSYSNQRRHADGIAGAKTDETRQRVLRRARHGAGRWHDTGRGRLGGPRGRAR